jgi:hypothetical protein
VFYQGNKNSSMKKNYITFGFALYESERWGLVPQSRRQVLRKILAVSVCLLFVMGLMGNIALAENNTKKEIKDAQNAVTKMILEPTSLPTATNLGIDADPSGGINPFVGKILNRVMGIIGSIALLLFVYGGIIWMSSEGNEQQVTKGQKTLAWAGIGMFLIFLSYAFVNYFYKTLISVFWPTT